MGIAALRRLERELATVDYAAAANAPQPDDAYDWWNVGSVLMTTVDMVMRGRAAAARVFRRWADDDATLRPLQDCVPLLAEAADIGAGLFDDLHSHEDVADGSWRGNTSWRGEAAAGFGRVAEIDEVYVRAMEAVARRVESPTAPAA
jgi:hypothetical protein